MLRNEKGKVYNVAWLKILLILIVLFFVLSGTEVIRLYYSFFVNGTEVINLSSQSNKNNKNLLCALQILCSMRSLCIMM